jgi:hypothetical protein
MNIFMKVAASVVLSVFVPVIKPCVSLLAIARRANNGLVQTTVLEFI